MVRFFLSRGWGIGSGGAHGADTYALRAVVEAGAWACARSVVFLPGKVPAQDQELQRFVAHDGRVVAGAGDGRLALLARSRRLGTWRRWCGSSSAADGASARAARRA